MDKKVKIESYEYDGTPAGFHLMMERLYPGDMLWAFKVTFLDDNLNPCWRFTGTVFLNEEGTVYRKGDYYQVKE